MSLILTSFIRYLLFPGGHFPARFSLVVTENTKQSGDGYQSSSPQVSGNWRSKHLHPGCTVQWMHSVTNAGSLAQCPLCPRAHLYYLFSARGNSGPQWTLMSTHTVEAQWSLLCTGRVRRRLGVHAAQALIFYGHRSASVLWQSKLSSQKLHFSSHWALHPWQPP